MNLTISPAGEKWILRRRGGGLRLGRDLHDAESGWESSWVEICCYHSIDDPAQAVRNGLRGNGFLRDCRSLSDTGGLRRHEAVGSAIVDCAAGEVGAPSFRIEEGEERGLFVGCHEVGDYGETSGKVRGLGGGDGAFWCMEGWLGSRFAWRLGLEVIVEGFAL